MFQSDLADNLKKFERSWLAACWLWLCLILGGASQGGAVANLLLQAGAAMFLSIWLWRGGRQRVSADEHVPLAIIAAAVAWTAIMFVPLPPALWQILPGRDFVADGYRLLGMDLPWLPMAMSPERAMRSLLGILAPIAAFFLVRRMDPYDLRRMLAGIVVIAFASAALGIIQLATGTNSVLRFYSPTNQEFPVGLFANTNHFSVFLACSLPLAAAWVATSKPERKPRRNLLIGLGIYAGFLALVLLLGRSLSGLAFLILASIGAAHILWGRFASARAKTGFVAGIALAALLAVSSLTLIGTGTIGSKFEDVPNSRGLMTPVTIEAGAGLAPVGGGLGSFAPIYAMHQPDRYTSTTWVNHAHNDYAEIWLELGIPGVLLVLAFLAWFARTGYHLWQRRNENGMLIPQAAWMAGALLLLHSLVDYPLRTAALAAFFAVMVALLCGPTSPPKKIRN